MSKPETWVQVYQHRNFNPGPDGSPRKEFQRGEWDMPYFYSGQPRITVNRNVIQEWRRAA